jgi:hypothetical protein
MQPSCWRTSTVCAYGTTSPAIDRGDRGSRPITASPTAAASTPAASLTTSGDATPSMATP